MYKTIIIDDEQNCIEVLETLIKENFNDLHIDATFNSSKKALEYLKIHQPDLVFLDIQMPFINGIELLEKLENFNFHVVFTTAFDQYAIKAIKLSAIDYLLKPIDEELLKETINKFRKLKGEVNMKDQIQNLLFQYTQHTSGANGIASSKISVPFQDKIMLYDTHEIVYCQSNDNYTHIKLKSGEKILVSKTLKHFEDILLPFGFIRPHHSYIINRSFIEQYNKKDGGFIILTDGSSIPISRTKRDEIMVMFK